MDNYWASLNLILITEDTVKPSLPAGEINLKACAPEIRTRNLPADQGNWTPAPPTDLPGRCALCLSQLSHRGRFAYVVTNTRKYDRGFHHTMRHMLHWIDMSFELCTVVLLSTWFHSRTFDRTMFSCHWKTTLQSASSYQLIVMLVKLSAFARRALVSLAQLFATLPAYISREYSLTWFVQMIS